MLGHDRADLLCRQMARHGTHAHHDHQRQIAAMEKSIADLARRQDNAMDEREARTVDDNDEIGRAWAERLHSRFADLENQRRTKQAELEQLRITADREQPQQPELLDLLPKLTLLLPDAPDPLQRDLYAACAIKVRYDHNTRHVTIHATLRAETLPAVARATIAMAPTSGYTEIQEGAPPAASQPDGVALVLRVLPGARQTWATSTTGRLVLEGTFRYENRSAVVVRCSPGWRHRRRSATS